MTTQHRGGKGNFSEDREKASQAGKKGGEHSHGGQHEQSSHTGDKQQGAGNFADDPKRASEAGKKGGQH